LSKRALQRCPQKRAEFIGKIGEIPPEYLVFAYESTVNLRTTFREFGWAFKGKRAYKKQELVRGKR
jgi:hypothetical protein